MKNKAVTLLMCMLMVASTAPVSNAEGQDESSIWGITYDWSHFEGDAFNMTGVDVNELNRDLKEAASYAGFDLDYDQVLSGSTQMFIESWDESGPFTVTTGNGESYQVAKRITELTIRHGSMADTGMATNWSDGEEKIEAWFSAYQDYLLVLNANYVEYVDENMYVYGGELLLDAEFSVSMGFDAQLGVTAANEVLSPDISASVQVSFEIVDLNATWLDHGPTQWNGNTPMDYHFVMGETSPAAGATSDGAHTYCSSYEFQTYQMCRNGGEQFEFEEGEPKYVQHHDQGSPEVQGSFSSLTGYSLDMSAAGLPTDEFDLDIDVFNVALSDSIPDQGIIYGEMGVSSYALWGHNCPTVSNTEVVTVDGIEYQAQCGLVLPVPWAMTDVMEVSLEKALSSGVEELGEAGFEQVEEWLVASGLEGGDDDYYDNPPDFVCDDGETIPRYWFNDGYPDCDDGSDEFPTGNGNEPLYYEWHDEQPTEFPDPTEGSSLHHVLSTGELTYCTDPFYPPFEEYDANGDMVGFDIDVADHLASALSEEYGTPVQFVPVESGWDPIIPNLMSGEWCDAIISAMTKTEMRDSAVDFTRGYYTASQGVIGGSGSAPISDASELNQDGVTIGVQSGTISEFYAAENLPMATTSAYDDYPSLISALNNGDVMYALGDTPVLSSDGTIMATFSEEQFGIALREGNNELLTALDVGITNLVESDDYGSIFSTWLEGEPHVINDWSPDWDFDSQEYYGQGTSDIGFTCLYESWQTIPSSGVGDGYPDCYDGTDEEMQPQVWSCAVDVRVDSLDDTGFDSFEAKTLDHPGFPEWCGTPVGDLQISETQPNLPPADDVYGALIDDPEWQHIGARNASHWHEFWTEDYGGSPQNCEDMAGTWVDEYESCAFPAPSDMAIDGELIQGGDGQWTRYVWSGDYLYLAVPTSEGDIWTGTGPRVTDFICDDWDPYLRVQEWQVGDGIEDCDDGSDEDDGNDEDQDPDNGGGADPGGSADLERMAEALAESNLEKTVEAFSERLEGLLQDNVPEDPKYDLEDLCATMLWDVSDVRVLGVALVLEGGLLFGPQIKDSIPHPTTTINVKLLSGQAARDAKSGIMPQVSMDEIAPASKHDLVELYEILGPDYLPNLDTTDSDGDGTIDFFDTDDDNDGVPDWEDPEPNTVEAEAESSSLPAHGLVASLSVIAAAAMLIPRRDD